MAVPPRLGLRENLAQFSLLVAGWLIGLPVPLLIMWAPTWGWVVVANLLLGVNQGRTWSTTVITKVRPGAGSPWASTRPPATGPSPSRRSPPGSSPSSTGCARRRSSSASPTPRSARAAAIARIAATTGFGAGALVLGAGTAMVYPAILAAVGDVAHPLWRARSVGIYRLWRDLGFAVGALLAGIVADLVSITAAIYAVAALTALCGLVVAGRMYETHRPGSPPLATQREN
jgi:hypothetical protein